MSTPTLSDPRIDAILQEVTTIRRRLDAVGASLGVPAVVAGAAGDVQDARPAVAGALVQAAAAPRAARSADAAADVAVVASTVPDRASATALPAEPPAQAPAPGTGGSAPAPASGAATSAGTLAAPTRSVFTPARILAAAGALVTVLGVGFLLVVAIAAGLFGPIPRVVTLVALSAGLAALARRQHGRGRSEAAIALAGTSVAAAFGVVVAATAIYAWVPVVLGVVVALLVAAVATFVAHRWGSELLAGVVDAQVLVLLGIVLDLQQDAGRAQYIVFAALAWLPMIAAVLEHRWMRLFRGTAAALALLALSGLVDASVTGDVAEWVRSGVAVVVLLLVAACAFLLDEWIVAAGALAATVAADLMLRATLAADGPRVDIGLGVLLTGVAGVIAHVYRGRLRFVAVVGAAAHLFTATVLLPTAPVTTVLILAVEGLVLLGVSGVRRSLRIWVASTAFSAAATCAALAFVTPFAVLSAGYSSQAGDVRAVLLAVVVAVTGALHTVGVGRLAVPQVPDHVRGLLGVGVALYGVSAAISAVGGMPGMPAVVTMAANVLITLLWVAVAVTAVARGRGVLVRAGYVLLLVAVGKLFLADLHSVNGILRAVLFVLTGLGLIAAASWIHRNRPAADGDAPAGEERVAATTTGAPLEGASLV